MPFSSLGLSEKVTAAVLSAGYSKPTPIQEQSIPHVLARRDVLGIAQTGTGKTAAFVLPMLTMLEHGRARARMPRTLILEPTRELAAQVEDSFDKYGTNHKLNVALLIGGVSFDNQETKLTRGVDVLIATPGRLLDHFERGRLLLSGVELLVIDEADRMLDMGFIPDIERICKLVPFTRQTLFFTATMPTEIRRIVDTFLHNPMRIEVSKPASTVANTTQLLVSTGREPHDKRETLRGLLRTSDKFKNAIIFCNRKREVALLHRSLQRHGFNAVALHGDMDQPSRMAALDQFRNGESPLLIASDVAARGLDIPEVSHIINFDVPHHADDYVHRIGRTGRAGRTGTAFTLVAPNDRKAINAIESLIGQQIAWASAPAISAEESSEERPQRRSARPPRGGGRPSQRSGERTNSPQAGERPNAHRGAERANPPVASDRPSPQRGERTHGERPHGQQEIQRERPRAVAAAIRKDEARSQRAPEREQADQSTAHLPAFLFRPTRVKA